MRFLYSAILLICFGLGIFYASRIFYNKTYQKRNHILFTASSICSALCALGYAMRYISITEKSFYIWRIVGSFSLFTFLFLCQFMMDYVFKGEKWFKLIVWFEIILGSVIVTIYNNPHNSTLEMTDTGYITHTLYKPVSIMFSGYSIFIILIFICVSLHMIQTQKKNRNVKYAYYFLALEITVSIGFVFDTLIPSLSGKTTNIQACAFFQFIGLDIMYHAVHHIDKNEINMANMTTYISQVLQVPVFIFDEYNNIAIKNVAANSILFFQDHDYSKLDFWDDIFHLPAPDFSNNATETISITAKCRTNDADYQLVVDPIFDDYHDFLGYIVVANDISENVRYMNEAIRAKADADRLKEEALRANATKSSFLANMSHEIRTPMNSILGFSNIALDDKIDDVSREYFLDIKESANSLLSIINDILDIEKIEAGKMTLVEEEYRPANILHEVCNIIQVQANNKDLKFYTDLDASIPDKLYGDKVKLRQILINLLNNAVKYTKEGHITLSITNSELIDDTVKLQITVSDTGIGIKDEEKESVFEMFRRVDEKTNSTTEGSGLGLSITKGMITLMGGTIELESEYGKGSTFIATIFQKVIDPTPMANEIDRGKTEHQQFKLSNIEILAVDDNMINLKVIKKILQKYGLEIDEASSGSQALEMCKEKNYDIVFMDQMMPVVDGVTAMNMIRKLGGAYAVNGKSKIVVLTANAINGVRDELINLGFDDYLMKPIDIAALEKMLESIIPAENIHYSSTKTVQEVSEKPEAVPLIDKAYGLNNFGGDEDSYNEIVSFLIESAEEDLSELGDLFAKNDIENFTIKIHGMKSQCNYIGGLETGEEAKLLEFAGKASDIDFIAQNLPAFIDHYKEFIAQANKLLN